jgi:hypothetical protein
LQFPDPFTLSEVEGRLAAVVLRLRSARTGAGRSNGAGNLAQDRVEQRRARVGEP